MSVPMPDPRSPLFAKGASMHSHLRHTLLAASAALISTSALVALNVAAQTGGTTPGAATSPSASPPESASPSASATPAAGQAFDRQIFFANLNSANPIDPYGRAT